MFKKIIPKTSKGKIGLGLGVIAFAIVGAFLILRIFAATAQISLVSDKSKVKKDETFVVSVNLATSGEPISIAEAYIDFDSSQVSYVSTDYAGTSFQKTPDSTSGNNFVKMSSLAVPAVTGNVTVGRITFKALTDTGSIPLSIDTSKSVVYSTATTTQTDAENILTDATGTVVEIDSGTTEPDNEPKSQIVLTSSATTPQKDTTFDITVGVNNNGVPIGVASAYITFDPTKVEYVSTTYDGVSSFDTTAPGSGNGAGYVVLGRFQLENSPTSNVVIGKVTFKALAAGNANFNVNLAESVVTSVTTANNVLDGANNLIISIMAPPITSPDEVDPDPVPTPTPTTPTPTPVNPGTTVKPASPTKTSSGKTVTKTDYSLNGQHIGTNTPGNEQVAIDTSKLDPGTYEVTTTTTADDGSTEETKSSFSVMAASFAKKLSLPIAIALAVLLIVFAFFVLQKFYKRAVPFYKTIH